MAISMGRGVSPPCIGRFDDCNPLREKSLKVNMKGEELGLYRFYRCAQFHLGSIFLIIVYRAVIMLSVKFSFSENPSNLCVLHHFLITSLMAVRILLLAALQMVHPNTNKDLGLLNLS